ncbi:putative transcriptional regulatory protein [Trichoplax sp. H2]|nr:putative transcriptional regulatory protein [Trichoplax sp. H2]|eukprot:RDD36880.1 putative transcriptional regulatory protein [Trichoplax sp. H2]
MANKLYRLQSQMMTSSGLRVVTMQSLSYVRGNFTAEASKLTRSRLQSADLGNFNTMWVRGMAGHNKWSKIRHKKAANDASRSNAFSKIIRDATHAVKEGGPDPESNYRLASCISQAKSINMPKATLEYAIKNAAGENNDVATDQVLYEGRGPGNAAYLVEVLTTNRNRTRLQVKQIFTKYGGSLADPNSVIFQFSRKGCIAVESSKIDSKDALNKAFELAIEIGVEDVKQVEFNDQDCIQFVCEVSRLNSCSKSLQLMQLEPVSATLEYLPQAPITLSKSKLDQASKLVEELSDHDDVIRVHDNISISG